MRTSPLLSALAVAALAASATAPAAGAKAKSKPQPVKAAITKGTLRVTGGKKADTVALRVAGKGGRTLVVDLPGKDRTFKRSSFKAIAVSLGAGNDKLTIDERPGAFTPTERTTVDGGSGNDRLAVVGSNAGDSLSAAAATRGRVRLALGAGRFEAAAVETLGLSPVGGADTITVGDLRATAVTRVAVDLAGKAGGVVGDARADTVVVNGTAGADAVSIGADASSFAVGGLKPSLAGAHAEPGNDRVVVNGLGGADALSAAAVSARAVLVTLDGGAAADRLTGGAGPDALTGGDGNDTADGNGGADVSRLGAGDDVALSDPGDGSETVSGDAGIDTLAMSGTSAGDAFSAAADGARVRVTRDVDGAAVLADGVDTLSLSPLAARTRSRSATSPAPASRAPPSTSPRTARPTASC